MSDNGEKSWWTSKLVIGPLVAGLTAVIVAVVTPVGENLRELLFPTLTVVEGFVQKGAKPVPRVKVVLDESTTVSTTDSGRFLFQNVSWGVHAYKVLSVNDQLLFYDQFSSKQGEKEKNLGVVSLDSVPTTRKSEEVKQQAISPAFVMERKQPDYRVELLHRATLLQDSRTDFESNTHRIDVWIAAQDNVLSRIERATYYLHPTFNPSVVSRYSPEDRFSLSFTAWGQFELKAKVYFKDGQVKDLSRYLSF
jgi:hypothetical protein